MSTSSRIITIDCQYIQKEFAASYLRIEGEQAVFIETNTTHSVPLLLKQLKDEGLDPENVKYVIITHVHLDHAGGTAALMQICKNAKLLAHPKAARHMINPEKLISSARKVYGEKLFDELYGVIGSIDPSRVQVIDDGQEVLVNDSVLKFIYTKGHATHHFSIVDEKNDAVFTGDTFGLFYPILQKEGFFILPSTSPTDFDPKEALISFKKIADLSVQKVYPTHFGIMGEKTKAYRMLVEQMGFYEQLQKKYHDSQLDQKGLKEILFKELIKFYQMKYPKIDLSYLDLDLKINADGIAYSIKKVQSDFS